jgi:hypothetical protein
MVLAYAQTDPQEVVQAVDEAIEIRQATQSHQDRWAQEQTRLLTRQKAAQATIEYVAGRVEIERLKVSALQEEVAELERRLEELERLEVGLQDSLWIILRRLERQVAADLPFLPDERSARLASLRSTLAHPDVPGAEKLQRLLEALQVEAGYGSSIEVYEDRIPIGSDSLHVDVLRLGRLSLFWRTPDGRRAGEYDRVAGQWIELAAGHRRSIIRATEMATRRRPHELISLPLGRVCP